MKLTELELMKHENLQLRRQNIALTIQRIEAEEAALALSIGQRLNIDVRDYVLTAGGEMVLKSRQTQVLPEPEVIAAQAAN